MTTPSHDRSYARTPASLLFPVLSLSGLLVAVGLLWRIDDAAVAFNGPLPPPASTQADTTSADEPPPTGPEPAAVPSTLAFAFELTENSEWQLDLKAEIEKQAGATTAIKDISGLPAGCRYDTDSGHLTWTPTEFQAPGRFEASVTITGGTGEQMAPLTLRVAEQTQPLHRQRTDGPANVQPNSKKTFQKAIRLWQQAKKHGEKRNLAAAAESGEESLALLVELGLGEVENANTIREWLAEWYEGMTSWDAAESKRRELLRIREKMLGGDHWQVTDARLALEYVRLLRGLTVGQRKELAETEQLKGVSVSLYEGGKYLQAIQVTRHILVTQRRLLEEESVDYTSMLNNLAVLYGAIGEYAKAKPIYRQVVAILKTSLGKQHPLYANALGNMAGFYKLTGDYKKAEPLYWQASETARKALGEEHFLYLRILHNTASLYHSKGNYSKAETLYRQCCELKKRTLGEGHRDYLVTLNNLAELYHTMGDYATAERLHEQCLEIRKKTLGEEHPDYATTLHNLALLSDAMGNYGKAESLYRKCQEIRKQALGKKHPDYASTLNGLAALYYAVGDYVKAEPLFRQAIDIERQVFGEEHPKYANTLKNLSELYRAMGHYAKGERGLRKSMNIQKETLGEAHPEYATTLASLASFYKSIGDHSKAEPLYRQAIDIERQVLGEEHPNYANTLNALADLYKSMGDHAEAEALYQRAVDIKRKALGDEHPSYASSLNSLALLHIAMGDHAKAEPLIWKSHEIRKKIFGEEHPEYANTLNNLGALYLVTGNYAKAEPLFRESHQIRKKVLGEKHPDYANTLNNLAVLYRATGDYAEAELLARECLGTTGHFLEDATIVLSERQQMAMSQKFRGHLDNYLSLALESRAFDVSAARQVLVWKGATLVRQRAMRLTAANARVADSFDELRQVSRQLASLSRAAPRDANGLDAWRHQIRNLTAQRERLEARLGEQSVAFRQSIEAVTLEKLQAALTPGFVLIDYLQFWRSRPDSNKRQSEFESSLLVTVVSANGEAELIGLGPVAPVAEAIDTWRQTYGASPESREAGKMLRERLWEPVLGRIQELTDSADHGDEEGGTTEPTILVSTDGVLGRLPLAALPGTRPGTYLIEDHRMAMIPAPRLLPALVAESEEAQTDSELLLLGDVDYDARVSGRAAADEEPQPVTGRPQGLFPPLPGTAGEITALARLHHETFASDDDDVVSLTGETATEARFRDQATGFSHLHLATHGFFATRDTQPAPPPEPFLTAERLGGGRWPRLVSRDRRVIDTNPGLRSGLAFAGANQSPAEQRDDGILTAQEIAFLPLGNVDLLVLSACDTGLGQVAGGEGLLGVQRAFQVAGVRTTVASLWKVSDHMTEVLMKQFYRNLWDKKLPRLDALREAQLWILHHPELVKENPADRGLIFKPEKLPAASKTQKPRTPPFYWAAFQLAGDWR